MSPQRRIPSAGVIAAALLALAAVARLSCGDAPPAIPPASGRAVLVEGPCEVIRVIDGDTVLIGQPDPAGNVREYRVRLLGVDTPETVKPGHPVEPWGKEATAFTRKFLAAGNVTVRLDRRRIDRYGRSLAYLSTTDGGMLNYELVRNGLARASIYPGDSASIGRKLRAAEKTAQQEKSGIWSNSPP